MTSPDTVHQSVRLNIEKQETRLLVLQPASSQNDELMCDFVHASFEDESKIPKYEALSYEWGTPSPCYNIVLNGTSFSIRENLFHALRSLRKEKEKRVLWIDAVCINQADNAERCQQVMIMYLIYSKADCVIGWLGAKTTADNDAKSAFENLSRYITSLDGNIDSDELLERSNGVDESSLPNFRSPDWVAIDSILTKTWFSRVWIMQELALAPRLSFQCGNIELDRSVIESTLNFLAASTLMRGFHNQAFLMLTVANGAKDVMAQSQPVPLMTLLSLTRFFKASMPRDRVFACLRTLCPDNKLSVVPDYDVPDEQLYHQWAVSSLLEEPPFACFSLINSEKSFLAEQLPTWAPDWGVQSVMRYLYWVPSFEVLTYIPPRVSLSDCQKYLTTSGLHISTIRAVGTQVLDEADWVYSREWRGDGSIDSVVSARRSFLEDAEKILKTAFSPHEYPIEMLWRTLMANTTHTASRLLDTAVPSYIQSYEAFRQSIDARIDGRTSDAKDLALPGLKFVQAFDKYIAERKFGLTTDLRSGLFPKSTQPGDIIFAPLGAKVPFVFRKSDNGYYTLVGECYVHGVMYGELTKETGWEKNVQDITIR